MTTAIAPTNPPKTAAYPAGLVVGRVIAACRRAARVVGQAARKGGATVIGVAGLASIAVGAGMVYRPAGLIVGGALAVWFASLLPDGKS